MFCCLTITKNRSTIQISNIQTIFIPYSTSSSSSSNYSNTYSSCSLHNYPLFNQDHG
ncbi:hypothetical protein Hanom_Chr00s129724g01814931 [Helianthus anomalus]